MYSLLWRILNAKCCCTLYVFSYTIWPVTQACNAMKTTNGFWLKLLKQANKMDLETEELQTAMLDWEDWKLRINYIWGWPESRLKKKLTKPRFSVLKYALLDNFQLFILQYSQCYIINCTMNGSCVSQQDNPQESSEENFKIILQQSQSMYFEYLKALSHLDDLANVFNE